MPRIDREGAPERPDPDADMWVVPLYRDDEAIVEQVAGEIAPRVENPFQRAQRLLEGAVVPQAPQAPQAPRVLEWQHDFDGQWIDAVDEDDEDAPPLPLPPLQEFDPLPPDAPAQPHMMQQPQMLQPKKFKIGSYSTTFSPGLSNISYVMQQPAKMVSTSVGACELQADGSYLFTLGGSSGMYSFIARCVQMFCPGQRKTLTDIKKHFIDANGREGVRNETYYETVSSKLYNLWVQERARAGKSSDIEFECEGGIVLVLHNDPTGRSTKARLRLPDGAKRLHKE